jgi:hypothetical protein
MMDLQLTFIKLTAINFIVKILVVYIINIIIT